MARILLKASSGPRALLSNRKWANNTVAYKKVKKTLNINREIECLHRD